MRLGVRRGEEGERVEVELNEVLDWITREELSTVAYKSGKDAQFIKLRIFRKGEEVAEWKEGVLKTWKGAPPLPVNWWLKWKRRQMCELLSKWF